MKQSSLPQRRRSTTIFISLMPFLSFRCEEKSMLFSMYKKNTHVGHHVHFNSVNPASHKRLCFRTIRTPSATKQRMSPLTCATCVKISLKVATLTCLWTLWNISYHVLQVWAAHLPRIVSLYPIVMNHWNGPRYHSSTVWITVWIHGLNPWPIKQFESTKRLAEGHWKGES